MNLDQDLAFAHIVGEQIDDYLHAEVLFYPVRSVKGMQIPPLTIGAWLETMWRLNAIRNSDNAARIDPVLEETQAEVRKARSSAPDLYQTKARREFRSRLDSWTMFLDDAHTPASYASNVHMRFKLELLKEDVSQVNDQLARLRAADVRLREQLEPGAFVWEPELAAAAPKDEFWFLYGA
jgi:hypothetical protein